VAAAFARVAICTRGLSVTDSASRDIESMLVESRATLDLCELNPIRDKFERSIFRTFAKIFL